MQLQNQNNQSLISQINNFERELRQSGKDPQQLLSELIKSGKFSSNQIENAKRLASQSMGLFSK